MVLAVTSPQDIALLHKVVESERKGKGRERLGDSHLLGSMLAQGLSHCGRKKIQPKKMCFKSLFEPD